MKSKTLFYLILITFLALLIPAMHAQTFSVIHNFDYNIEGGQSYAGVTIRGNALYGTTATTSCGTVYQLTHSGANWLFTNVAPLFRLRIDGCDSQARVVFGPDDHLYGTVLDNGTSLAGGVFKVAPQLGPCKDVACYWTENAVYAFVSHTDGQGPGNGDLIWDQQGNIYDTTVWGGTSQNCYDGCGTVYELTPSGNGYAESFLYSFSGPDGAHPEGGLVLDSKGNLYGTTAGGGSNNFGTVFELSYVVGVGWTEHVLYNFQNASDGSTPEAGLIIDSSGNLYGTTFGGGSGGGGTIFELSPSGDTWTFKLLYSFSGTGFGPQATLSMDGAGNLYGTTSEEGIYNQGNVFKLTNTENGWAYTSLHDFTGGADGGFLVLSNVAIDTDGTLYGTTVGGGENDFGVVWMIKP